MRKLLLALPLVAGASWAGTTYYSGTQTQPAYDKLLSQLNQMKAFQFVSEEYDAGFVKSTAVTKVVVAGAADGEALFRLKHVIDHSPVGVDNAGTRVGANSVMTTLVIEKMNPELEAALNGKEPMVLHTRVDMTGRTVNALQVADFSLTDDDEQVDFGGAEFEFVSEPSGRIHGNGALKAFEVINNGNGGVAKVAEAPLALELQYHSDGIYSGTMDWDFPSFEVTDPSTGMNVSLKQFKLSTDTRFTDDVMNSSFTVSTAQLQAPVPVTSFKWDFAVNGFPMEGIKQYKEVESKMMEQGAFMGEMSEEQLEQLVNAYKAMFAPGSGLNSNLKVSNQGGDMALAIELDFLGDGSASGTDNMQTVRDVAKAFTATAKLDADASAVDMTPLAMFMGHPMAAQYVINDGVKYTADLKVEDILLYANGETQDIVEMFGLAPMLDMPLEFLGNL